MGRVFNGKSLSVNRLRLTARAILPSLFLPSFNPSLLSYRILFYPVFSYAYCAAAYPLSLSCHGSKGSQLKPLKRSRYRNGATGLTQEMETN
ncbi:Uncharacterised protein [Pantoea agglomerans]|uniref:Uncharacterized protein n=1 Tax=Enterobacter agglomerans TaxID=549 RepID=A0A379AGH1_ENTAG|nr:Uncharacterised protein [Pantoea agglomerans]